LRPEEEREFARVEKMSDAQYEKYVKQNFPEKLQAAALKGRAQAAVEKTRGYGSVQTGSQKKYTDEEMDAVRNRAREKREASEARQARIRARRNK
jgi:hypothetical protein